MRTLLRRSPRGTVLAAAAAALLFASVHAGAFFVVPPTTTTSSSTCRTWTCLNMVRSTFVPILQMSSGSENIATAAAAGPPLSDGKINKGDGFAVTDFPNKMNQGQDDDDAIEFTFEEQRTLEMIQSKASEETHGDLRRVLIETLPNLSPRLVLKLRRVEDSNDVTISDEIRDVSAELNRLLEDKLTDAKTTLRGLLHAGEIRKLDSLIGKASREGRLDAAFFNILTYNLQDAIEQERDAAENDGVSSSAAAAAGTDDDDDDDDDEVVPASRAQILRHIYTRCQEEVEKNIPPGTALLNKLLRTEQDAIRMNLYQHYLAPRAATTVIRTPDGKPVELNNRGATTANNGGGGDKGTPGAPPLVALDEFVEAISRVVEHVRTIENAGDGASGIDHVTAAAMVESCRQIAKEARIVIGESYGRESDELRAFQDGLQPVFRPSSPDSPYIKGQE